MPRLGNINPAQADDEKYVEDFARRRMQMMGLNPADYRVELDADSGAIDAVLKPEATIEVKRG